jgi:hypothetical protein
MKRLLWLTLLAAFACSEKPPAPETTAAEQTAAVEPAEPVAQAEEPVEKAAEASAPAPQPRRPERAEPAPAPTPSVSVEAPPAPAPAPPAPAAPAEPPPPAIVEVEVPAGTVLELELLTALDSGVNQVGDEIQARTLNPIYVEGDLVLGSGALVEGRVTEVQASGRVKGRAVLGFTFERLDTPGGRKKIRTSYVAEEAASGKKKDAAIIGGAAGVGAIVGGIIGGKKGAAIGATIGGAGGTGVVLGTKGQEIRLAVGSQVNVRLDDPVVILLDT